MGRTRRLGRRTRHAVWLGMRDDRDTEQAGGPDARYTTGPLTLGRVRLTHPEREILAGPSITKADVWHYYRVMAPRLLPEIAGRPLSLLRCPDGVAAGCFFQRHRTAAMPTAIRPVPVIGRAGGQEYLAVDDLEGLMALVQLGAIELHPWGARADRVDRPDRVVLDLDPDTGLAWARVVRAAHELRARLRTLGLESFVRTTGGKGLHVVVPIERRHGWPAVKRLAAALARAMAADSPQEFTASPVKARRSGRIFVDYLRNERGATAVASYSLRARPAAPVAMPVAWDALDTTLDPLRFRLATVPDLVRARADPWAQLAELRQRLPPPDAPG